GVTLLVGGTDGTVGPTDAAGGIVDGTTWGLGAEAALKAADSGTYLSENNNLLITGPTGTNVMDLAVALRA
ncbi:MAG: MOFRL family protein, partial [Pseudodonghicola sp.]